LLDGRERGAAERGAAQVGVQHHAGGVDHRAQGGGHPGLQQVVSVVQKIIVAGRRAAALHAGARRRQGFAQCIQRQRAAVGINPFRDLPGLQQLIHRWEGAKVIHLRHRPGV
jgi:hypothetical protein